MAGSVVTQSQQDEVVPEITPAQAATSVSVSDIAATAGRVFLVHLEPHSANQGQTLAIAEQLRKENWDIHIVCRASCRLIGGARERSLPVHPLPDDGGKGLPMAWKLLRILRGVSGKDKSPSLVHACDPSASHLASVAWRMNKKLRLVHTRRVPIMEPNHKAVRCYQVPAAKIITDSLAGKIALRLSGLEPHLLHTITCGIDPSSCPKHKERNDGRFVFAMTGELMPQRGHALLFDALPLLEAKNADPWEVRILGDGPFFANLLQEAETKNVARHTAFLCGTDIGEELCACDGLVLPAAEGESYLPLILQGWAARIPVITINRLDHAEILQDDVNCLLVQPQDHEGLAEKMAMLAADASLRQRLVEGGRAALAKFSVQAMVAEHKRLYREILA
ncbi:glycosyltransferase family 4 protein [Desulfovibrio sp. OttesenSCG-928-O18]|nr:glycosyltransferase family 4 protein [Desulfovibrio sp. OttesenSCG-928-O18]